MEKLIINTGLNSFVLPDRILNISAKAICVEKKFCNTESYLCLETIAQAASMHVKWLSNFSRHSFLLKVDEFMSLQNTINGICKIDVDLIAQSTSAYSYSFKAIEPGPEQINGKLVIGTMAFDENFRKAELVDHNRKVFECLMNV